MQVDNAIRDEKRSLQQVLQALTHHVTARDNLGPEGVAAGLVLTSMGPTKIPEWQPVGAVVSVGPHTHPTSDIIAGIFITQRLGSGAADATKWLRGDSSWSQIQWTDVFNKPTTLAGLQVKDEVIGLAGPMVQEPDEMEVMTIPGPAGRDGVIGRDGAMGPPGLEGDPLDEWPVMIPGASGAQGNPGAPGAPGASGGTTQLLLEESADDWHYLHGPSAPAAVAPVFPPFAWSQPVDEFDESILGTVPPGTLGGGGTPGRHAKWVGGGLLGNSLMFDVAGGWTVSDSHIQPGGMVSPNPADSFVFDADTLPNYGIHWFADSRSGFTSMSLAGYGGISMFTNGIERLWIGAGTVIRAFLTFDAGVNNTYDIGSGGNYFRNIFAATGFGFSGTNVLTLNAGNTQLNSATDLLLASGGFVYWTQRLSGLFEYNNAITGDGSIWDKMIASKAADQATFVNVQTNISGFSFAMSANTTWYVDITLGVTMGTAATGVKFYFTGPGTMTGEINYGGNVATVATWQSLYQAVLTVPGTFFVTGIITGQVTMRCIVRCGATPGTVQLVGITGGATTTCAVKKGSVMRWTRI